MTKDEVMQQLESMGTAQNRKTYGRHGICGDVFGVSYANQYKLQKKIKADQALSDELWATGNHDARVLALLIGDPTKVKMSQLDKCVKELDNQLLGFEIARLGVQTPHAWKCVDKWIKREKQEWIAAAGWDLLATLCSHADQTDDERFAPYLEKIEADLPGSLNRVRHSMNGALIAIGGRGGQLEKQALAVAKRIGKVDVDHGDTSCKTPDATAYIKKLAERRKKKKPAAKKKVAKV